MVRRSIWVLTSGLKFGVRIKYRKTPVFWLPKGAFPGFIEWILSLTSAPKGSVSVAAWFMIVDYAIKGAVVSLLTESANLLISIRNSQSARAPMKTTPSKVADSTAKLNAEKEPVNLTEKKQK